MEFLISSMYHEKMFDKTPRSFSHRVTQQRSNATMKEKSACLCKNSHPLEGALSDKGLKKTQLAVLVLGTAQQKQPHNSEARTRFHDMTSSPGQHLLRTVPTGPCHTPLPWLPSSSLPLWSFICGSPECRAVSNLA